MSDKQITHISEQPTEEKKGTSFITIAAAFIGILTPAAYLLGLSYYQGYTEAFGVEADGFPLATPDIYVFSYTTIGLFWLSIAEITEKTFNFLVSPPLIYWILLAICICTGSIYWLLKTAKKPPHPTLSKILDTLKTLTSKLHWKNNDFTKAASSVAVPLYIASLILTVSVPITLFWWIFPLAAYSKGNSIALEKIKVFREKGCFPNKKTKWSNCFFLVDKTGKTLHEGLLIAKNDKELAFLEKDGSYIIRLQDDYLLRRRLY